MINTDMSPQARMTRALIDIETRISNLRQVQIDLHKKGHPDEDWDSEDWAQWDAAESAIENLQAVKKLIEGEA